MSKARAVRIARGVCLRAGREPAVLAEDGELLAAVWWEMRYVHGWLYRKIANLFRVNPAVVLDAVERIWDRIEDAARLDAPCGECRQLLRAVGLEFAADDRRKQIQEREWGGDRTRKGGG